MTDEMFELYRIPVKDGIDRADLWIEITEELLRLGVLSRSLRASSEFHRHIQAAVRICNARADQELLWARNHLAEMEGLLAVIATNDIEIDDGSAE